MGVNRFMAFLYVIRRCWHLVAKSSAFFLFGVGGIVLAFLVFPMLRVLVHPTEKFQNAMRSFVCIAFRGHVWYMRLTGLISLRFENRHILSTARGMIVVANHPSLIDVVILIAYIPQADCIVKAKLWSNPFMRGVVSSIYIQNSLEFDHTTELAQISLEKGNNLVIFPEGTRSSDGSAAPLRRGGAHLALRTGHDIIPVQIIADNPAGLRKGDSLLISPKKGVVRYILKVLEPIHTNDYTNCEASLGSRMLTTEIRSRILP